jgi:cellulose synthase/poly-beta-1,6-N-acetylglucosamine synthase-like glycosyltransferase
MQLVNLFLAIGFGLLSGPLLYLYTLALAAVRERHTHPSQQPRQRFAITIAAHNEEVVIADTVRRLRELDYPADAFDIHVAADHCTDHTAAEARAAGAIVHERSAGPAGSKGAALRWLFARVFEPSDTRPAYDAAVIFDADTLVEPNFLRIMDAGLTAGDQVIQGQHVIRNPEDGWFPALTWAMFIIDNRLQNVSRSNLGWSAKNMGDSICFRADVLRRLGWGEGLTEDYAFRQQLLLEGIKITYEPAAIGFGEAPLTWSAARTQRARWLRGAHDASHRYARELVVQAVRRRSPPLLDGALQAYLPSYSSLTVIALAAYFAQLAVVASRRVPFAGTTAHLLSLWSGAVAALFAYPLIGLAMERAPLKAYLAILSGPLFIVWRTWLALMSRQRGKIVVWIRTPRKQETAAMMKNLGAASR